jgi:hypothetical protein
VPAVVGAPLISPPAEMPRPGGKPVAENVSVFGGDVCIGRDDLRFTGQPTLVTWLPGW